MKKVFRILFCLHLLVGIGAMAGGLGAILNPNGPMGISVDMLKNSPFNNFFIPGIILFSVIGVGNIISALSIFLKFKYQGFVSGVFSLALVVFIVVQCIFINTINILHVIFFIIGLIEGFLSVIILLRQRLFQAIIAFSMYNKQENRNS